MLSQKIYSQKYAFTLAEALLTLVILGVVAALTVPGLKKHTDRQTLATQLKNGYSTLNKSLDYAYALDDSIDISKIGGDVFFTTHMMPNMNIATYCNESNMSKCIAGDATGLPFTAKNAVVLTGGFTIANNGFDFLIDVNGPNEPNQFDVDIYQYKLSQESIAPESSEDSSADDSSSSDDGDKNNSNSTGTWSFIPVGKARDIMDNGWKITHF